ncbi:hypothetical protein [Maricaulis salignorans]|uniref:hypothetical protein n=1 Tax=Maricaulis salignorans TaxID=144026 RepID=UPI003A91A722
MRRIIIRYLTILTAAVLATACASNVTETHYFAAYSRDEPREPIEFFRLQVAADAQFSSSRFVAGFYDERAVDFLFDELRMDNGATSPSSDASRQLSSLGSGEGAPDDISLLSPSMDNGAFVLIFSTNADSIARTIGSFSESEIVAQAVTNLLNQERFRGLEQSNARASAQISLANAMTVSFGQSLERAAQAQAGTAAEAEYLRALGVLARSMGRAEPFSGFDEARGWFGAAAAGLDREARRE